MRVTFETHDFDALTAAQQDWDIHHRPLRTDRLHGNLCIGSEAGIQVDLERWNTALELTGTAPARSLSFVVPLGDDGGYRSGGIQVESDRIDLFGPGREIYASTSGPAALIACSLDLEALERAGNPSAAARLMERAAGHQVVQIDRQATRVLGRGWLELLELFGRGTLGAEARRRLLDTTITHLDTALEAEKEASPLNTRRRYRLARRARDYLLDRVAAPPTIGELCTFLGTGERNLHHAFREVYGVSPKRFLKARRLYAVRRALQGALPEKGVSEIAMDLGFWDLGRFAGEYRAMFGELPSQTLQRPVS